MFPVNATFCVYISNKIHYKLAVNNFYTFMPRLANMAYSGLFEIRSHKLKLPCFCSTFEYKVKWATDW